MKRATYTRELGLALDDDSNRAAVLATVAANIQATKG